MCQQEVETTHPVLVLGGKFPTVLCTSMYPAKRLQLSVSPETNFLPVRCQLRSRVVFLEELFKRVDSAGEYTLPASSILLF